MKFYLSMDVDYLRGSEAAIPDLCDFSAKNGFATSFFVTGLFAQTYPEATKVLSDAGYDVGIHGWDHGANESGEDFGRNSYDEQLSRIKRTTQILTETTGHRPIMNRCPNLWVSENTIKALETCGYKLDSSVPARRMIGQVKNYKYFAAPTNPYFPSLENLRKRGNCGILEVPPAAFFMPINLSSLRMLGLAKLKPFIKMLSLSSKSFVFYGHPAEYLHFEQLSFDTPVVKRHSEGIGPQNYELTLRLIEYACSLGYEPARLSDLIK